MQEYLDSTILCRFRKSNLGHNEKDVSHTLHFHPGKQTLWYALREERLATAVLIFACYDSKAPSADAG